MKIDSPVKLLVVLLIVAALLPFGCLGLAERVATHLAEKSLDHQHDWNLLEGDLARYRSCLHQRGGSCQGGAETALPGSTGPGTPTRAALGSRLGASVDELPSTHPAHLARSALGHPALGDAVHLHNYLRGHEASSAGFSATSATGQDGTRHTARLKISISQIKSLQETLHRTTAAGGWHELRSHAAQELSGSSPGNAGHEELREDHRRALFVEKYVEAYFRNGRFLAVDFTVEGSEAKSAIARQLERHAPEACRMPGAQDAAPDPPEASAGGSAPVDCEAAAAQLYEGLRGSGSSVDHQLVKVSQSGFVSRWGVYSARFPSFGVDIDPLAGHLGRVTTDAGGSTGTLDFSRIGTQLIRVVLEAVLDAHEGLPAVSAATARTLGETSLPPLKLPDGHVDANDFNAMTRIGSHVESATGAVLSRVVAGIGPVSLNNRSLEELIVTLVTTSVRKAMQKATWCWYACNLDAELKRAEGTAKTEAEAFAKRAGERVRLDLRVHP